MSNCLTLYDFTFGNYNYFVKKLKIEKYKRNEQINFAAI